MVNETTTDPRAAGTVRWTSGTNLALGIWLIIAPFVLGYSGLPAPLWNDLVCGLLIAILAGVRLGKPAHAEWASWTNAGIGAWLIIAPWVLAGYLSAAVWNDVIVGIVVLVLGAYSASAAKKLK
ncbi:SPW repeat protein [Tranquillimonas alkanivorans]|uniref:SPW repeat-containing protein n=1 Tax=Tranquillimonas alkanivorans TaxID=441119 RepID=A0A1I5V5J8_9RHOB|nr:SPW repeat protein [Tranquillimonas alkanivorans]SFQ02775.1 SPW repeat-containing protein [Tranquillimonas alkanivorans]